jgi:hypothetical protein
MKLSVAANYDIELVRELAELPVTDVYGKLPSDLTGGGRPGYLSTSVTLSHLKSYIDELKKKKIEFTYLLNSSCLANREWDRRWQKKFFRFMKRLEEIGVARLTVSTPVLFRIIRKSFPDFYLKVGVFAQVDTPSRARYWQDLGADEITLESFSINRDFERLAKIRESVSCGLQLIVNHPCLPNCPIQYYHQNGFSHSCDNSGKIFIDYCFLTCSYQRLKDPSLFIKSQWIRPEDLSDYEDAGFDNFKILERSIPSVQLLRRVRAYSRRKSPPDFADLILPHGFSQTKKRWTWLVRNFFRPLQIRPTKLVPIYRLIKNQGILLGQEDRKISIDSSQIPDNFLDKFKSTNCTVSGCKECGYCSEIAGRAVIVNDSFQKQTLAEYERVDELITTGKLWDV